MGTVYPATYMRGNRETFGLYPNEPNFPRCAASGAWRCWASIAGSVCFWVHALGYLCADSAASQVLAFGVSPVCTCRMCGLSCRQAKASLSSPATPARPCRRFTAWLGQNSSSNKQKRLLGELHTRMLSSGSIECDRCAAQGQASLGMRSRAW